jgi:radical SAM superfamily enzyme YgiQ (UPF0313 family)
MTKILFIRAHMTDKKSSDAMQPLVFAILDAITPLKYEREFVDDCIEDIDFTKKVEMVALTFGTFSAKRAYYIAERFKQKGSTIIMGGFHASAMPDEALEYSDTVVIGDAEPIWDQLLKDFENHQLKPKYTSHHSASAFRTHFNRKVFEGKDYFHAEMVQWSRGCQHNCDFCCIKSFYGNQILIRPIKDVIEEIASLDRDTIFFVDDNLYHGRQLFKEFLHSLAPLNKKWACQISIDVAWDTELVDLMRKSGCMMVLVGIENFNADNLQQMNKGWNLNKIKYSEAISLFRGHGIMVYGTFIFGYDHDTPGSFEPTVEFAINNKLFLANFNPLYPMPGTALYERLSLEDRLEFKKWWLHPDFYYGKTMFRPVSLTPEELEEGCFSCKKKFNSLFSIFRRLMDLKSNAASIKKLILFLAVNFINRREIHRKQHQKLGQLK